ncbi:MAG: homocysteine S-methyltransferase family protein [Acidobacteria bacterium]|nr:homocysteine S-methyltransferase family protein [Acidobacteriota bacterium]
MENILNRLQRGDVIVGDGALGTMLMQRGLKSGEAPETVNLSRPQILEEIASLYLEAGSEIVTTNTFGGSPLRLQQFSLEKETESVNRSAVEAVRRAVGQKAYIAGSVGPSGKMLKPLGNADPKEISAAFRRQISALLAAGIDIVCIETMIDLNEAVLAIEAARSLDSSIPVMATVTFNHNPQGYFMLTGATVKDAAATLEKAGAHIIGSNCGEGAAQMVEIAREFRLHSRMPIAIQSNAGLPAKSDAGLVYSETPDFVAGKAIEMLDLGVQIIGGCCGTNPDHIRAIRKAVDGRRLKPVTK